MSAVEAMVARLRAQPEDEEGWLVYADWLTEQGDVRGEILTLDHKLRTGTLSAQERLQLNEYVEELYEVYHGDWGWDFDEVGEDRLSWYLPVVRQMRGRWNEGEPDALTALVTEPLGRAIVDLSWGAQDGRPTLIERHCARVVEAIFQRIERAFDGVTVPDEEHRTLFQAEAADGYDWCDQSRDHRGRWQDLPEQHFLEAQWAFPHLDEQGIRYYLPAAMGMALRRLFASGEHPWVLESLNYTLLPTKGAKLRDHTRRRFSLLDAAQRKAICTFVVATSNEIAFRRWSRVVEAELQGPREDWFDLFWPPPAA